MKRYLSFDADRSQQSLDTKGIGDKQAPTISMSKAI